MHDLQKCKNIVFVDIFSKKKSNFVYFWHKHLKECTCLKKVIFLSYSYILGNVIMVMRGKRTETNIIGTCILFTRLTFMV